MALQELYSQYSSGTQFTAGIIAGSDSGVSGLNPIADRLNSIAHGPFFLNGSALEFSINLTQKIKDELNIVSSLDGDPETGSSTYSLTFNGTISGTTVQVYSSNAPIIVTPAGFTTTTSNTIVTLGSMVFPSFVSGDTINYKSNMMPQTDGTGSARLEMVISGDAFSSVITNQEQDNTRVRADGDIRLFASAGTGTVELAHFTTYFIDNKVPQTDLSLSAIAAGSGAVITIRGFKNADSTRATFSWEGIHKRVQ